MDECRDILETFPLGKTPGNDGLPTEFYTVLRPLIVKILVDCFSEAHERKETSYLQRRGIKIITIIMASYIALIQSCSKRLTKQKENKLIHFKIVLQSKS